jgi:hypothetical protein
MSTVPGVSPDGDKILRIISTSELGALISDQ